MPEPPWKRAHGVSAVLEAWQAEGSVKRCLAAERALSATPPSLANVPELLGSEARQALHERGIEQLYSHQVAANEAALAGKHVVVATPTASVAPSALSAIDDPKAMFRTVFDALT